MDKETIDTYNREAERIAQLHSTLTPCRIYELIGKFFIKGGTTIDIGCGIGRDTNWLNNQHWYVHIPRCCRAPPVGVRRNGYEVLHIFKKMVFTRQGYAWPEPCQAGCKGSSSTDQVSG